VRNIVQHKLGNATQSPSYFRARIATIEHLISTTIVDREEKNNERTVLRNGVFPQDMDEEKLISQTLTNKQFSNAPLSFTELTRFNTWFAMYPEKIAGSEIITTSREFPISVKGKKEDIIQTIKAEKTDFSFLLQIKRRRASAKLNILQL